MANVEVLKATYGEGVRFWTVDRTDTSEWRVLLNDEWMETLLTLGDAKRYMAERGAKSAVLLQGCKTLRLKKAIAQVAKEASGG